MCYPEAQAIEDGDVASFVAGLDHPQTGGGGEAVAGNQIGQMVDPWPAYVNNKNLTFDGERMQRAVECYRIDKVTPPVDLDPSTETAAPAAAASGKCVGQLTPGSAQPAAGTAIGGTMNTSAYK